MRDDEIAVLYRRHVPAAVALCRVLVHDEHLARDLAHDAFVRVAGRLRTLRDPDAFNAYLRRAVINAVASHARHVAAEQRAIARLDPTEPVAAGPMDGSDRAAMTRALSLLPPRQRLAVVCRFYLDWSEAQTAESMQCSVGTVKSLTSRGLAALRERQGEWMENADEA